MVSPFLEEDIAPFLALAEGEGWACERWELEFLQRSFPQGCLVFRDKGKVVGYITSVSYGRSGWIGNLLVEPHSRRSGIGRILMLQALAALLQGGVETVWLTASEQGAGLYLKLGFLPIDRICRWRGLGVGGAQAEAGTFDLDFLVSVDGHGWGDERASLVEVTCGRGRVFGDSSGFLCCQPWESGTQLGPWGALKGEDAGELLARALTGGGESFFLDVPAGNLEAATLLRRHGFSIKGSNVLMYLGKKPSYEPRNIFALGSMGSMG